MGRRIGAGTCWNVGIPLDRHGEEGTGPQAKALNLQVHLRSMTISFV